MFLSRRVVPFLVALMGLALLLLPSSPASAQSTEVLLENPVCRENPHSEDCICAEVRKFGFFPKSFSLDDLGVVKAKDMDGDDYHPYKNDDGVWVDDPNEADNWDPNDPNSDREKQESDLVFAVDDRYAQHCAMSYFRENQRRLWVFAVALGAVFSVLSLIWIGVTYMQYSASGVELSRARALLMRVIIGLVIMACALLIWEGLNEYLFSGVESWTQNRGVFYDLK